MLIIRLDKLSVSLVLALLLQPPLCAAAESVPAVSAGSAVLMAANGQCLLEKDVDTERPMASTTKLMTALVVLEHADLEDRVTAKQAHCAVEGSSMYLKAGETYTVRELLLGLLLASGNDAALALAEHVGGSQAEFVRFMNQKARELHLTHTGFANPHGLDAEGHVSTARDLAVLMLACMENDGFRELTKTPTAEIRGNQLRNHNRLLLDCPGCIGGKTGYTRSAGRCLVSCCERGGLRLVCVTLSDPDDWRDHRALYDWAYREYRMLDLSKSCRFDVPVLSGSRETLQAAPAPGACLVLPMTETVKLRAELPRFVFAPVKKGETAGSVSVIIQARTVVELPLYFSDSAALAFKVQRLFPQEDSRA